MFVPTFTNFRLLVTVISLKTLGPVDMPWKIYALQDPVFLMTFSALKASDPEGTETHRSFLTPRYKHPRLSGQMSKGPAKRLLFPSTTTDSDDNVQLFSGF